jgi:hypothetical protein
MLGAFSRSRDQLQHRQVKRGTNVYPPPALLFASVTSERLPQYPPPEASGYTLLYGIMSVTDPSASLRSADSLTRCIVAFREKVSASILQDPKAVVRAYRATCKRCTETLADMTERLVCGLHPSSARSQQSDILSDAALDPMVAAHIASMVHLAVAVRGRGARVCSVYPMSAASHEQAALFTWDDALPGYVLRPLERRAADTEGPEAAYRGTLADVRKTLQHELRLSLPENASLSDLLDVAGSLAITPAVIGRATKESVRQAIAGVVLGA